MADNRTVPGPSPADDPWARLLNAANTEAAKRIGLTKTVPADPGATRPEDPNRTVPEDPNRTVPENPNRTIPEPGLAGRWEKGSLLLGTYRIESSPILGGMGSVWQVHHLSWNVDLAMKRPQPQMFADEAAKQSFMEECRSWINLGLHPNIVSCYYVREIEGVPAIFSEWMENGSLENRIEDGTVYLGTKEEVQARLLDIAIQYARGLHYAHEAGLIHQDVKPDNLLLTKNWEARVADFGLAKARAQLTVLEGQATVQEADPGATLVTAGGGYTPAYCSMEQMDGKQLTRRTDIYSWAVSVMEMYYGSRPWQNGVVAGMSCRDYFAESRYAMPEPMEELLSRCMEMNPENRPHDFGVIETELLKIWQDVFGRPYPRETPRAAADTADSLNNQALSYLDLGMKQKAEQLWEQALAADPSHLDSLYNQGLLYWRDAKIPDLELLERLQRAGDRTRAEELAGRIQKEQDADTLHCFSVQGRKDAQICFSSDGSRLILTTNESRPFLVLDAETGSVRSRVEDGGAETGLAVAAGMNGDVFWSSGEDALVRYSLRENGPTDFFANDWGNQQYWSFSLSEDESRAVLLLRQNRQISSIEIPRVEVWDLRKDQRLWSEKCDLRGRVFLSPDGKHFAAATADRLKPALEIWNADARRAEFSLPGHKGQILDLAVTPDFHTAYTVSMDGTIRRWDLRGRKLVRRYELGVMSAKELLALLPDRRLMILNSGEKRRIRVLDPESGRFVSSLWEKGMPEQSCAAVHPRSGQAMVSCMDGRVFSFRIPRPDRRADWSLSRIGSTLEYLERERKFHQRLADAKAFLGAGNPEAALKILREIRKIPGYEVHPETVALSRRLARFCEISGLRGVLKTTVLEGHWSAPVRLVTDPSGQYAVSACGQDSDRQVLLWDLEAGEWIWQVASPMRCFALAFMPDGNRILVHNTNEVDAHEIVRGDPELKNPDGQPMRPFTRPVEVWPVNSSYIHALFPTPDGTGFLAGVGQSFSVWKTGQREPAYSMQVNSLGDIALSPDGSTVWIASAKEPLRRFRFRNGMALPSFPDRADTVRCSPDGRWLALTLEKECTVLDAATGEKKCAFPLPRQETPLCFSHDSRMIWCPGEENRILLRRVEDGKPVAEIPEISEKVTALAADSRGLRLLAACSDYRILCCELDWDYCEPK